jgi:hypothetical protein
MKHFYYRHKDNILAILVGISIGECISILFFHEYGTFFTLYILLNNKMASIISGIEFPSIKIHIEIVPILIIASLFGWLLGYLHRQYNEVKELDNLLGIMYEMI